MALAAGRKNGRNTDIDAQIAEMRTRISRALAAHRREDHEAQQQIDLWARKLEARRAGSDQVIRKMSLACVFAAGCADCAEHLQSPAYICQDLESILAAHTLAPDDAIIVLDVGEAPSYRRRWNRLDPPIDPLVHALDRASAGLLSLIDIAMATSTALARELLRAEIPSILLPDYPVPHSFDRAPGVRQACRLAAEDRLALLFDRADAGFSRASIVASLNHLPGDYHLAIVPDRGGHHAERYERELDDCTGVLGLGGRVHLLPPVSCERLQGFAASADVGVIGLDPAHSGERLVLPGCLFAFLAAGLPVASADLPEIRQALAPYRAGSHFDHRDPRSIAASFDALVCAKKGLAAELEKAGRELVWSRNERFLLALFPEIGAVTMMQSEPAADQSRTNRIASTLLDRGIDVTIAVAQHSNSPSPQDPVAGASYVDIPIDICAPDLK